MMEVAEDKRVDYEEPPGLGGVDVRVVAPASLDDHKTVESDPLDRPHEPALRVPLWGMVASLADERRCGFYPRRVDYSG